MDGTADRFAVCPPDPSTTSTGTFRPPGSAHRAKSASACPVHSALAFGSTTNRPRPLAGWANPDTDTDADLCRPRLVGRVPRSAHTRRVTAFSPSRASSAHRNAIPLSAWTWRD